MIKLKIKGVDPVKVETVDRLTNVFTVLEKYF